MNTFIKHTAPALALLGLALGSCQPNLENNPKASKGTADFTKYVAVGNSLTAGYEDGGVYLEGQQNSYPNILAQQFKKVGGGDFPQPLFTEAQSNGSGYLRLAGFTATGSPITVPVTDKLAIRGGTASNPLYTKYLDPVQNLGIPDIHMSEIETVGYGNSKNNPYNPYFERITPDGSADQTYLQRVAASNPTFFTEWLGSNDVLFYATAGGAVASPARSITDVAVFTDKTSKIIDALTANGAKGVVSTIPDVASVPFFTTVGPSLKTSLTAAGVPGLVITTGILSPGQANKRVNIATSDIRDANGAGRQLFTLTSSPYLGLIGKPSGKYWRDFYQQAKPSLPSVIPNLTVFLLAMQVDTTKAFGASTGNPFPSTLILDDAEQALVATATTTFNNILTSKAQSKGLAVFDVNTFFRGVAINGYTTNGVNNTASFLAGNIFSIDGVHPTPRGYAVLANEMIKVINATYGATIPQVDPTKYRGVRFP